MFHKISSVKPMDNFFLLVKFQNGENRKYNVASLFENWDSFRTLSVVKGLFEQVKVDSGGYGISWNNDIDLSCDELYFNEICV